MNLMLAPIIALSPLITAGLGGLSLAQRLKKVGITFRVKRDLTMNYSAQGYCAWIGSEGLISLKNTYHQKQRPDSNAAVRPLFSASPSSMPSLPLLRKMHQPEALDFDMLQYTLSC